MRTVSPMTSILRTLTRVGLVALVVGWIRPFPVAPDPAVHRGEAPPLVALDHLLPDPSPTRGALERLPLSRWWERTRGEHLARLRLTGSLRRGLARIRLEMALRRPPREAGDPLGAGTRLHTLPLSWLQEVSRSESGQRVLLELPEHPGEVPEGTGPVWERAGSFRFPLAPGAVEELTVVLGLALDPPGEGRVTLPLALPELPVASLQVDLEVFPGGEPRRWVLPAGFRAEASGGGVYRIRARRERLAALAPLELGWVLPEEGAARSGGVGPRLALEAVDLGAGYGFASIRVPLVGDIPSAVHLLALPRPGESGSRVASLVLRDPWLRPRGALPLALREPDRLRSDPGIPEGPLWSQPFLKGVERAMEALSAPGESADPLDPGLPGPGWRAEPWFRQEPWHLSCNRVRRRLEEALVGMDRLRGTRFPVDLEGAPGPWVRRRIPVQVPAEGLLVHSPRWYRYQIPGTAGDWWNMAFLSRELREAGLLGDLRDPGFGPGSLGHYLVMGDGRVFCRYHDSRSLLARGLRGDVVIPGFVAPGDR